MLKLPAPSLLFLFLLSCSDAPEIQEVNPIAVIPESGFSLIVLGNAQDAGFPQIGCTKTHCTLAHQNPELRRMVSSIALVDHKTNNRFIFDATPDLKDQLYLLNQLAGPGPLPAFFLTHAHMGHYTGLMQLGHEAMGSSEVPVYAMPRMTEYLQTSGPWSQLVNYQNINLMPLSEDSTVHLLSQRLSVRPFRVPHREEYSEAVGFQITALSKKIVFIPDIDKWEKWDTDIRDVIEGNDLLFLDGSFFANGEIPGRDMSGFPHPLVSESMQYFDSLPASQKEKVYFIHFNHTNPLILSDSEERKQVYDAGYNIAAQGMVIPIEEN